MSISFEKSLEAKEGMREVLDAAETFAPVAAPIAAAVRVVGNVAAAVITPVVNNVCSVNSDTRAFCAGLVKPFNDFAEQMASVPDPLRTDYGFSEEEAARFHQRTEDVATAVAAAMPFAARAAKNFVSKSSSTAEMRGNQAPSVTPAAAEPPPVYIPKKAAPSGANYTEYWCRDLYDIDPRFERILLDGRLRLVECNSEKILLLTLNNLKAAPGTPSTLFFIKELPRLAQQHEARRILVRASFFNIHLVDITEKIYIEH